MLLVAEKLTCMLKRGVITTHVAAEQPPSFEQLWARLRKDRHWPLRIDRRSNIYGPQNLCILHHTVGFR
jgi:hypothetical protein